MQTKQKSKTMKAGLIFPHQLVEDNPLFEEAKHYYLIEEYLFFKQYNFHKQKLVFHRTTMKNYEQFLLHKGFAVTYVESTSPLSDVRFLIPSLKEGEIIALDPVDNYLRARIETSCSENDIALNLVETPTFLNTRAELGNFFTQEKKKFFQTKFYIRERKKRKLLLDEDSKPIGGKWTFDAENRKKYPAKKVVPFVKFAAPSKSWLEAKSYVEKFFPENIGNINRQWIYPSDFKEANAWFEEFLVTRFTEFGTYEDAIVSTENILNHSLLSPLINTGLLKPEYVVQKLITYAHENNIAINNTEGIIRQIIGWREFIRGVYEVKGTEERTRNFWGFTRKIPLSFYTGETGIAPIDLTIKKLLQTGYNHHIERLMILGNFMVLCEFDPDEVYRWFMEMYIDSYDWVMVPNVYGMSQFADGGIMSTKPYISGSNYIMKMSDYKKGDWQQTWDGLFWRFMDKQRDFFLKNPRLGMLVRTFDKMDAEKRKNHLKRADAFLNAL